MSYGIDINDGNMTNCTDCIKHGGDWECDRTHCRKGTKQQATKASDCISRQAAIDAVGDVHPLDYNAVAIVERLKNLPSAEPERKKGQWIWCASSDHLKCSECGTRAPMYMDYANGDYQEWLSDFCPECGCEMKGFEDDE